MPKCKVLSNLRSISINSCYQLIKIDRYWPKMIKTLKSLFGLFCSKISYQGWYISINLYQSLSHSQQKENVYTVFCTAGLQANYYQTYNLNLSLGGTRPPLDPHPTFLGITLDSKLTFKKHLERIEIKMAKKIYVFEKI